MLTSSKILKQELCKNQVGVWYLGQVGFLFKSENSYLAIDPYLSDYVDQNCCEFVQWKRKYNSPISPNEMDFLNYVVCTHSHYDHTDPITISAIAKSNPSTKFIIPAPYANDVTQYGVDAKNIIFARAFEEIELKGFTLIPIPSAHEEFHTDDNGNYCELGYVIKTKEQTFFHAGDMCMYEGLVENLEKFSINIAFLPINGRDYFRNKNDIIGNFNTDEAVLLAKEINADILVPMHHDLYDVNSVDVGSFVNAIEKHHPFRKYHIFSPGELYISV